LPAKGEVHIWGASLELPESRIAPLELLLAADERKRAARFRFPEGSNRFVASRAVLRIILGSYLNTPAHELVFSNGAHGKPALIAPRQNALRFNSSRSQELALYAVSSGSEVGVDVERVRPDLEVDRIAELFFSQSEAGVIRGLRNDQKIDAFFSCWVSKEAYLKATGHGLSQPLSSFEVSFAGGTVPIGGDANKRVKSRWLLRQLEVAPGFKAAFVAPSNCDRVRYFWWSPGDTEE
jgi:4'-phosphopantetheinyl transferase